MGTYMDTHELDRLIESWKPHQGTSEHLRLEIAAAAHRGRPLDPGAPVPGCACSACTGVEPGAESTPGAEVAKDRPDLPVERARRTSILKVADRLNLGNADGGRYGEPRVRCPFHDDTDPSLRLNPTKGAWFCFPCGEGGDGIDLVMRVRGVDFVEAVKWMVGVG